MSSGRPRVGVAVPAAGLGRRLGGVKKTYLMLEGRPVLARALQPFLELDEVIAVVVALSADDVESPPEWLIDLDPRVSITQGGATRRDSVWAALTALPAECDVVAVHDGARPLINAEVIRRCIDVAAQGVGAVAGVPTVDTMKRVDSDGFVIETPERSSLWNAQTPQVFPVEVLTAAYQRAMDEDLQATDDAAVVEANGGRVRMVEASTTNLKVTRPGDLELARVLLEGI